MGNKIQIYVSEPNEFGEYHVAKFDFIKNAYRPIKGENYQFKGDAEERARKLNLIAKQDENS